MGVQRVPGQVDRALDPLLAGRGGAATGVHDRPDEAGAGDLAAGQPPFGVLDPDGPLAALVVAVGEPVVLHPPGADEGARLAEQPADLVQLGQPGADPGLPGQPLTFRSGLSALPAAAPEQAHRRCLRHRHLESQIERHDASLVDRAGRTC